MHLIVRDIVVGCCQFFQALFLTIRQRQRRDTVGVMCASVWHNANRCRHPPHIVVIASLCTLRRWECSIDHIPVVKSELT